jgi:hypothetical protein
MSTRDFLLEMFDVCDVGDRRVVSTRALVADGFVLAREIARGRLVAPVESIQVA